MTTSLILISIAVAAVMLIAAAVDGREGRIPNWLTVGGLAVALVLRALPGDPSLAAGFAGAALGLTLGFALFAAGGFGAGDAKLLATSGAFLGPATFGAALLGMGVLGGVLAVVAMMRSRAGLSSAFYALEGLKWLFTFGRRGSWRTLESPSPVTVPYGIAIAAGTVGAWFLPFFAGGS